MKKRIVLISCVSQKLPHRAKAKDLYISTLFKLSLRYAKKLNPDCIYILSAKYGLLNLDQEIDPYERTLNNMNASEITDWASNVLSQLRRIASLENDEFIVLAGYEYRKYLLPHLKNTIVPLKGMRIGEQIHYLKGQLPG